MTKNVAIPKILAQKGKDYLTNRGFNLIELEDMSQKFILEHAANVDGIILMTDPFDNIDYKKMPNLKVIARHGVGYDNVDQDYWGSKGVWVTITPNANASTVAETTFAEILDISKGITTNSIEMRKGDFDYKDSHKGFDLYGKTLGIMGYGRIGRKVAKIVRGLDMNIIIYDPYVHETSIGKLVDKDTLFKDSDILTLHMAVTPENKEGIGREEFELMKDGASLINLGRGALVNQADLIDALKEHKIRAAALDVFDEEPLPLKSDFYKLDNVLLTPHIASNTQECMDRMAVDSASEVVRVLDNEKPKWNVNQIQ